MGVRPPVEKNFRRPRVKPSGRRKPARAWLSWRAIRMACALLLAAYAGYRAFGLVADASMLKVNRLVVRGNLRLSSGEVEGLAHGLYGTNLLTVDLNRLRRSLLESPWVADVALRRVLPATIEIAVVERRPIGVCRLGGQLYLIDRTGTVIDEYGPRYAEFDLPIVDGLVRAPHHGKPSIDEARAALAARVIDDVQSSAEIAARISQIDVSDVRNAVVLLDDDPAALHLGEERFRERLRGYVEVAQALRERVPDIDYVDLRFEQRVYVKPREGETRSAARAKR